MARINPEDEDALFARMPKRVREMATKARKQRRVEQRAEFAEDLAKARETQKGKGW